MKINSVGFRNFRNLSEANVCTDGRIVILEGANGAGKTSFLESLYAGLLMTSFRARHLDEMIRFDSESLDVAIGVEKDGFTSLVSSRIGRSDRIIQVNGRRITSREELLGMFPCVVFSYDDKSLVVAEPQHRRKFANQIDCFCDPAHIRAVKSYNQLIKQRNVAIRSGHIEMLEIYDSQLSSCGYDIYIRRRKLAVLLEDVVGLICHQLQCDDFDFHVHYKSVCDGVTCPDDYFGRSAGFLQKDIQFGQTHFGIHTDDFVFCFGKRRVREVASTGQVRFISVVLRLAELKILFEKRGVSPVILVDDALLELDGSRKAGIFEYLMNFEQVFYTFMPEENFYGRFDMTGTKRFRMENGLISEMKNA